MTENSLDRFRWAALTLCAGAALIAMQSAADAQSLAALDCVSPAKPMARLELVFGLGGKRKPISQRAFTAFLGTEVTPRFPAGFTLLDGHGQWQDSKGTIEKEASRLLLIWYERDSSSEAKIEAIRTTYKKRFHQQSVLRVDSASCVSF
jgi:hypothetical protein